MCSRCSGASATIPTSRAANPSIRAFNERAAINARMQGSAADIIRRAMIRMDDGAGEDEAQRADAAAGARRAGLRGAGGRGREDAAGGQAGDGRRADAGGVALGAAAGRRPRRRTIGTRRIEGRDTLYSDLVPAKGLRKARPDPGSGGEPNHSLRKVTTIVRLARTRRMSSPGLRGDDGRGVAEAGGFAWTATLSRRTSSSASIRCGCRPPFSSLTYAVIISDKLNRAIVALLGAARHDPRRRARPGRGAQGHRLEHHRPAHRHDDPGLDLAPLRHVPVSRDLVGASARKAHPGRHPAAAADHHRGALGVSRQCHHRAADRAGDARDHQGARGAALSRSCSPRSSPPTSAAPRR